MSEQTPDGSQPEQSQSYPGVTDAMEPRPQDEMRRYRGRDLLAGKRALVTGGESGIGRAVSVAFAKEGADVAIAYLSPDEDGDAQRTQELVEAEGRRCLLLRGDLGEEAHCDDVVQRCVDQLGGVDVLVLHHGTQEPVEDLADLSTEQWDRTVRVNLTSFFWLVRAALPHLPEGSSIVTTGSVNGMRGNKSLIDYSATKGAIHAFTQSLAQAFLQRGIRANCVAPGPVWTPLVASTFPAEKVGSFGQQTPMGRAGQPDEIAPSYVFFASDEMSSFYTGELLAPVGGETHPG